MAKASAELINPEKALTATIPNCSPRHCAQGAWAAGEELLFRGFLFRGWRRSRRDVWSIVLTALLGPSSICNMILSYCSMFAYGLMLGWLRWVTGSTILTMLLHGLINFEGMLETFVALMPDIDPAPRRISPISSRPATKVLGAAGN